MSLGFLLLIFFFLFQIEFLSGLFYDELLRKTARLRINTPLVDVVKAVIDRIDHPDIDNALNVGEFLSPCNLIFFLLFLEVGREYVKNPTEFKRKALVSVRQHALPRD
jgi:hypothetical protein